MTRRELECLQRVADVALRFCCQVGDPGQPVVEFPPGAANLFDQLADAICDWQERQIADNQPHNPA